MGLTRVDWLKCDRLPAEPSHLHATGGWELCVGVCQGASACVGARRRASACVGTRRLASVSAGVRRRLPDVLDGEGVPLGRAQEPPGQLDRVAPKKKRSCLADAPRGSPKVDRA
jgi:hypothetical protein